MKNKGAFPAIRYLVAIAEEVGNPADLRNINIVKNWLRSKEPEGTISAAKMKVTPRSNPNDRGATI